MLLYSLSFESGTLFLSETEELFACERCMGEGRGRAFGVVGCDLVKCGKVGLSSLGVASLFRERRGSW